ncbi:unnamed protein product [Lymnaea stagnalis]|uniref:Uncharacterized protein n=1 Tax=Lymnaea stagnalis TaxID=6523 RepID=A0AAV2IMX2_LYMST
MSINGFSFSKLEEESNDDEVDMGMGSMDRELQPHLSALNSNNYLPYVTPLRPSGENTSESKDSTEEICDYPSIDISTFTSNAESLAALTEGRTVNDVHSNDLIPTNELSGQVITQKQSNVQVQYAEGKINVMQDAVVVRPDGSQYIDTQGIPHRWLEHEQPLRQRRLRLLKIFSILACILFFPTGIFAIYYAFRAEKEFQEGIAIGNIDRAQKFAKRSEKFIIVCLVMAVVIAALIVTIIERPYGTSMPRGTLVG